MNWADQVVDKRETSQKKTIPILEQIWWWSLQSSFLFINMGERFKTFL